MAASLAIWNRYRQTVRELDAHRIAPPTLPGRVHAVPMPWGRLSYRLVKGSEPGPALVFVHGWGRSGDSVWWPILSLTRRTAIVIDLPGHGRSLLDRHFTFSLAAEAVTAAIADAGVTRPVMIGHSMGGPIALTALRSSGPYDFAGFIAVATSAYWVRRRHRFIVAAAPVLLAQRSPILMRAHLSEARRIPESASRIAWEYAVRPTKRVLEEAARDLRRFDARSWSDLNMPPSAWIVTLEDGIIAPVDQRASAAHFGIPTFDFPADHRIVGRAPVAVAEVIERCSLAFVERPPIGIRRRASVRPETLSPSIEQLQNGDD